jgi:hypothetical protein
MQSPEGLEGTPLKKNQNRFPTLKFGIYQIGG